MVIVVLAQSIMPDMISKTWWEIDCELDPVSKIILKLIIKKFLVSFGTLSHCFFKVKR